MTEPNNTTTDASDTKPLYSRNLSRKERDDRQVQLLQQHRERRNCNTELVVARAKHTDAAKEVKRLERKRETIDEMLENLAIEVETGHAVIPEQLKLDTVPVLADDDGDAVDDPRDEASGDDDEAEPGSRPAKKKRTRRAAATASN